LRVEFRSQSIVTVEVGPGKWGLVTATSLERKKIVGRPRLSGVPVIALLICLPVMTGCFSYKPATTELINPNEEIRVIVTDDAALRLNERFGVVLPLEGQLSPLGSDSFGLAVWVGRGFGGSDFATVRQTVPLVRADIVQVQRRQLSVKRTTYFTLGVVAALTILVDRLGVIDLPWEDRTDPPTPPEPDPFRRRR
jgi:hypothetical protein